MLTEAHNKVLKDPLAIDLYPSFFAKSRSVLCLFPRSSMPLALNLTGGKMLWLHQVPRESSLGPYRLICSELQGNQGCACVSTQLAEEGKSDQLCTCKGDLQLYKREKHTFS